jgi:hypothetical protein
VMNDKLPILTNHRDGQHRVSVVLAGWANECFRVTGSLVEVLFHPFDGRDSR